MDRREALKRIAGWGLAGLGAACTAVAGGEKKPTREEAEQDVLVRNMFDVEQLMGTGFFNIQITPEQWREVFERAVDRVEAGEDPFSRELWREKPVGDVS